MREYLRYRPFRLNPVNITLIYVVLGFIWIAFSDRILENMIADPVAAFKRILALVHAYRFRRKETQACGELAVNYPECS